MNDYDVIVIGAPPLLSRSISQTTAIVTTNEAVDSQVLGISPAYATTAPSSQNR